MHLEEYICLLNRQKATETALRAEHFLQVHSVIQNYRFFTRMNKRFVIYVSLFLEQISYQRRFYDRKSWFVEAVQLRDKRWRFRGKSPFRVKFQILWLLIGFHDIMRFAVVLCSAAKLRVCRVVWLDFFPWFE